MIIASLKKLLFCTLLVSAMLFIFTSKISALPINQLNVLSPTNIVAITSCGDGKSGNGPKYTPSFDINCSGHGNAIMDATFGIIKFLSNGVGIIISASLIYAGIQYIVSTGDPQATALAVKRMRSNVTALILFIFAYAILNYLIPGAILS